MSVKQQTGYLSDYWTTEDDLHFSDFRPALYKIITEAETPLTVGVFGTWGSGKTSLMRMLYEEIENQKLPRWRAVWFTAWKYDREDALWRSLILRTLQRLYPQEPTEKITDERQLKAIELLDHLQESVYRPVDWQQMGAWTVDWWRLLQGTGKAGAEVAAALVPSIGLAKKMIETLSTNKQAGEEISEAAQAIRREVLAYHRTQLQHIEQFEQTFKEALAVILGENGRLIVFVDDLDRCLPEKVVEVLEAIKLFLEVEKTVFVLGMDREVIEQGVKARYGALFQQAGLDRSELPISGDAYLEKIVQTPFHLPPLQVEDLEAFIEAQDEKVPARERLDKTTRAIFARGLYPNPRQIKRAINIYRLLKSIAATQEEQKRLPPDSVSWPLLAKTVVIQTQYPKLYQSWRQIPTLVQTLEIEYERQPSEGTNWALEVRDGGLEHEKGGAPATGLLAPYLNERFRYLRLEGMLRYPTQADAPREKSAGRMRARFEGLTLKEMGIYLRLAGAAESQKPEVELPDDILPGMLSGDIARVRNAVAAWNEQTPQKDEARQNALHQRLVHVIGNAQSSVQERLGAGTALSLLGDPRDLAEMVEVAAGEFLMGSTDADSDAYDNEKPQHPVHVPTFCIGKYPVSNGQYAEFVAAAVHRPPGHWRGPQPPPELRNHPVVNVSWRDAVAYCQWLSQHKGREYHLPTEAEWEKAARGSDGRTYPLEGDFDAGKCNMGETGIGGTSPVGMFPDGVSPYSCLDMSGNVWEWTTSKFVPYPYADDGRNQIDQSSDRRVLRGGAFYVNDRRDVRCAYRYYYHPDLFLDSVGFRVVAPGPLNSETSGL